MASRVLLVDDYEPWRRQIRSMLRDDPRWDVVGEAADGLAAVEQADALRPDLILLDIGLPLLSGIDAARRILARDRSCRILFLSEQSASDIIDAALQAGGRAYVRKAAAARELMPAMESLVEGHDAGARCRHDAGFYADERSMLDDFARYGEAVLNGGKTLIVLGIARHRLALQQSLEARGLNVNRLAAEGRYRWWDVLEKLSGLLNGDRIDEPRFWELMPPLITQAAAASISDPPAAALWGECAPTLFETGKIEAAVRLEQLWDELVKSSRLETLCAYSSKGFEGGDRDATYQSICAAHSSVHSR